MRDWQSIKDIESGLKHTINGYKKTMEQTREGYYILFGMEMMLNVLLNDEIGSGEYTKLPHEIDKEFPKGRIEKFNKECFDNIRVDAYVSSEKI